MNLALQREEDKKLLYLMTTIALFFAMTVTKGIVFPKPILYLGIVGGAAVLFAKAMKRPELMTYVLVVYLPFSRVLAGDFGGLASALNLTNVFMIFLVVVWMNRPDDGEPKWLGSSLNAPFIIFMILGLVSIVRGTLLSSFPFFSALTIYKRWFTPFFFYFLALNTVKDRHMIHNVFKIMMIVTTIVGLMAQYDYMNASGSSIEKMRIGGICDQPNQMAGFFVFYMFLPYGLFLFNIAKKNHWPLLLAFLIQFRGIMVTFSRGGYLGFFAGLVGITWFRSKALFVVLVLATLFAYLNPWVLPAGVRYRLMSTIENQDETFLSGDFSEAELEASSKNRIEIWKGAILMIQDHPFFGVGYGLFQPRIANYWSGGEPIDAHNQYLLIGGEMGIPALLVFLWILFMMWFNAYKLYKNTQDPFARAMALGMIGGLFGLVVNAIFGSRLNTQEVSSYLWIIAAMVARLRVLDQRDAENPPVLEGDEPDRPRRRATLDSVWFEDDSTPPPARGNKLDG